MSGHVSSLLLTQVAFGLAARNLGAAPERMGVWTYGCSIGCPGCASPHTWDATHRAAATRVPVDRLLAWAEARHPRGLVISGGEPTEQAVPVTELAQGFRALFPDREIVLYTGLRYAVLLQRFPELTAAMDVVVAGPFVAALASKGHALAGSGNQEVRLQTPLARMLFADWADWPAPKLQVSVQQRLPGGRTQTIDVVTVGIPLRHAKAQVQMPSKAGLPESTKSNRYTW